MKKTTAWELGDEEGSALGRTSATGRAGEPNGIGHRDAALGRWRGGCDVEAKVGKPNIDVVDVAQLPLAGELPRRREVPGVAPTAWLGS